ncbi:MAG: hypothetical protein IPL61_34225 [Myxococcales bacterium]|nr:hypothetical protein [Myxococcales bacterium]
MRRIEVTYGDRPGCVFVRPLRGDDEESVVDADTWSAIALVDRLLVDVAGAACAPGQASALAAADRDRVLATVYRAELGDRIASTVTCPACQAQFDLDFQLSALCAAIQATDGAAVAVAGGRYRLSDGTEVRIPTGLDELTAALAPDPERTLLARCRLVGDADDATVAAALEEIAPLVSTDLDAVCPECGQGHTVRFDVQSFLLARLLAERDQRAAEVHRLARGYGWSLSEILSLPRGRRRAYVELIEREQGAR